MAASRASMSNQGPKILGNIMRASRRGGGLLFDGLFALLFPNPLERCCALVVGGVQAAVALGKALRTDL
eukprot:1837953-Pyramimonas_sp.AAC.1